MEYPLETWARHKFDPKVKCDFVANNHVESFNSWLGNIRQKPITGILESIAKNLMSKFGKRFQRTVEWTNTIVLKARNKLNSNVSKAATCELIWPSGNLYQITQMDTHMSYVVNLGERSCYCGEWQVSGVPYRHACAAITHTRHDFENFCSDFYSKSTYEKTYSTFIHLLHHDTMWTEVDNAPLDPPVLKRPISKPRVKRKREVSEPEATRRSSVITCSICGVFGHNKRRCEKAPTAA
ncbi:uncharacterized protein LOC132301106 [Cornus florida]|uniref:uncharacterized protein LOC132301106 n=1 Tax=Cornus florida TaxID=4283 RepID=UPI002899D259|nr:uncharacterized protein LOC132301106 [Cornus florida]